MLIVFLTYIFQISIKNIRCNHVERINGKWEVKFLKSDDMVITRSEVQNDSKKGRVRKLSYQVS